MLKIKLAQPELRGRERGRGREGESRTIHLGRSPVPFNVSWTKHNESLKGVFSLRL